MSKGTKVRSVAKLIPALFLLFVCSIFPSVSLASEGAGSYYNGPLVFQILEDKVNVRSGDVVLHALYVRNVSDQTLPNFRFHAEVQNAEVISGSVVVIDLVNQSATRMSRSLGEGIFLTTQLHPGDGFAIFYQSRVSTNLRFPERRSVSNGASVSWDDKTPAWNAGVSFINIS